MPEKATDRKIYDAPAVEAVIRVIRNTRVILDADLARFYGVTTKAFNQAVKRNPDRFPIDFGFQLTADEFATLRSQSVTSKWGGRRYQPYVFTEYGAVMAASVLNSPAAVQMSVRVYTAAATNEFTMWVEDQGENPVDPDFDEQADVDGDGRTTFEEYMADTDPGSSNEVFEVTGAYTNATGTLTMSYPASPNRYYQLEYRTNLTGGANIVSNLGWGGAGTFATNIPPEWYGTIRVRLTAP